MVATTDIEALDPAALIEPSSLATLRPRRRLTVWVTSRIQVGECQRALRFPEKASGVIERDPDELVRQAARALMYAASSAGGNFDGLYGLYDACNEIAAMRYEGAAGLGRIIIASKNHKDVKFNLELKVPIEIAQYRKVRKFLEISSPSAAIVTDSALIYGLGEVVGKYNPREESLFLVDFTSHYTWTLSHDDNALMVVSYREPCLPKERIEKEKFRDVLQRTFQDISRRSINKLWDLAIGATKQRHGAMVVISAQAEAESQRLRGQCFQIEPIELDSIYVQSVTSIDGALLVDANCVCHAIGVILDGVASEKGDSSRGARYNSAIRYLEQFGKMIPTVILIISEDGMINLIPDLKPRIRRSEIEEAIEKFRRLKDLSEFDRREFNSLMEYFLEKEFYLTAAECASINEVRCDLECRQGGEIWIRYPDLKENSEMNESYYL